MAVANRVLRAVAEDGAVCRDGVSAQLTAGEGVRACACVRHAFATTSAAAPGKLDALGAHTPAASSVPRQHTKPKGEREPHRAAQ